MPFTAEKTATVLIPSGPDGDHLFVISTDRCPGGKHLLLNLSSAKEGLAHDATCEVGVGEHPFVTKPSFIAYRHAQVQAGERIEKLVNGWYYKAHQPASEELTARALAGVSQSIFTPRFVITYVAGL